MESTLDSPLGRYMSAMRAALALSESMARAARAGSLLVREGWIVNGFLAGEIAEDLFNSAALSSGLAALAIAAALEATEAAEIESARLLAAAPASVLAAALFAPVTEPPLADELLTKLDSAA